MFLLNQVITIQSQNHQDQCYGTAMVEEEQELISIYVIHMFPMQMER